MDMIKRFYKYYWKSIQSEYTNHTNSESNNNLGNDLDRRIDFYLETFQTSSMLL